MGLSNWQREFDWLIQNRISFSAPVIKTCVHRWSDFSGSQLEDARTRLQQLRTLYSIETWPSFCTWNELQLSLFYLDLLDQHAKQLPPATKPPQLDIGCKNWSYLPALQAFRPGQWLGIEIDAHRRDLSLATRKAYGEYMAMNCGSARYQVGSLLDLAGQYAFITWFLPFVLPHPQSAQRIPDRFFQPEILFQKAWSLLANHGCLWIINQGEQETEAQRALLEETAADVTFLGTMESPFNLFKQPRFGWLLRKEVP